MGESRSISRAGRDPSTNQFTIHPLSSYGVPLPRETAIKETVFVFGGGLESVVFGGVTPRKAEDDHRHRSSEENSAKDSSEEINRFGLRWLPVRAVLVVHVGSLHGLNDT